MENFHENAMDIDADDDLMVNIKMDHADRSTKQTNQKINLLEMPREILEQILINLDGKHMLTASHVCKSFESLVEFVFAQKYAKELYKIDGRSERENSFHKIMLSKYGDKICELEIKSQDESLLELVEQKCVNLKGIYCNDLPRLIILNGLKQISLKRVRGLNRETFTKLIDNNPQLERLVIRKSTVDVIDILDGRVNMLKILEYECKTKLCANPSQIRLNSLESLKLNLSSNFEAVFDTRRLLRAIKCDRLKALEIEFYWNFDGIINEICTFKMLETLRLPWSGLTVDHLRQLSYNLPHVTKFSMLIDLDDTNLEKTMNAVLSFFPKLIKLKITLDEPQFNPFLKDFKESMYDFYGRFAKTNTNAVVLIANQFDSVSISKERIVLYLEDALEIHWMDNLNVKSMRQALNREWDSISEMKFINNCAQPILDISTLIDADTNFGEVYSMEFKSIGAVSINANTSRFFKSFPDLRKLKIHLDQRNAIDLLENLDENFCKLIDELWLNSKNVGEDPELKLRSDMTNILAKFENLSALQNHEN